METYLRSTKILIYQILRNKTQRHVRVLKNIRAKQ